MDQTICSPDYLLAIALSAGDITDEDIAANLPNPNPNPNLNLNPNPNRNTNPNPNPNLNLNPQTPFVAPNLNLNPNPNPNPNLNPNPNRNTNPNPNPNPNLNLNLNPQTPIVAANPQTSKVVIIGAGPSGLIAAGCLASHYAATDYKMEIEVYERNIIQVGKRFEFQVSKRREQVVTLQKTALNLLPKTLQDAILDSNPETVWPNSYNIPIRLVEDRLIRLLQTHEVFKERIKFTAKAFDVSEYTKQLGSADLMIAAEGGRFFGGKSGFPDFRPKSIGTEYALGASYEIPVGQSTLSQSENVILTLSQTRYLLNSSHSRTGYLNMRLTDSEWKTLQSFTDSNNDALPRLKQTNTKLWKDIQQGLKMFNIDTNYVKSVAPIPISAENCPQCYIPLDAGSRTKFIFAVGDAYMRVHFWPGRGLNSAIIGCVGLSRRIFWARSNWRPNFSGFSSNDFSLFSALMGGLADREIRGRSKHILDQELSPQQPATARANKEHHKEVFKRTMYQIKNRMESNAQWIHPKVTDQQLNKVFERMSDDVWEYLNETERWPTEKMSGEDIADLVPMICKAPAELWFCNCTTANEPARTKCKECDQDKK